MINMFISMSQLLKTILGTTYWIFNLQIIDQIGCNGSEQWGPHVSWVGKADARSKQQLQCDRISLPTQETDFWLAPQSVRFKGRNLKISH